MRKCENVSELAKELGIDRSVLYHWRNHLKMIEGGPRTLRCGSFADKPSTKLLIKPSKAHCLKVGVNKLTTVRSNRFEPVICTSATCVAGRNVFWTGG